MRTHQPGELRAEHAGTRVVLCGWVATRRDHGGVVFVDLRDASGVVQVVLAAGGERLRAEYVVRVEGEVRPRPEGTINTDLPTGEVEVAAASVEILAEAEPPPFPLGDRIEADESLRLRHRYLDLRRSRLQRNLRLRARVNAALRRSMDRQGFVEVETPLLIASTPEGARDFVVPSRLSPGEFYALPQSPQLFKQLLMVGGLDKYFQIARCLRDEDLRADRQFEFTHFDTEMSFAGPDDVMAVVTEAVQASVAEVRGERAAEPARLTWHEAMDRYGTDKPDVRFGLEIVDVSPAVAGTGFRAFQVPAVRAIRVPGGAETGRAALDRLTDRAKALGAAGLVWMKVGSGPEPPQLVLESPVAKFLTDEEQAGLVDAAGAAAGDLLLVVAGEWRVAVTVLGALRLDLGRPAVSEGGLHLVWVVDFPLFEAVDAAGRPVPAHHPFTMPHPDDLPLPAPGTASPSELLTLRSQAYDLVLNGWELGSGSARIHLPDLQQEVFSLLGLGAEEAQSRFGFLLDAFRYGAPPHAGFAVGVDRLAALLAGEENIREVIAFPKTQSGADPLTGAPRPLPEATLRELGLQLRPRPTPG